MWVFRLPHWVYLGLAPLIAVLGTFLYFDISGDDAARAQALKQQAPAAVLIENFDPAKNVSEADEVTIVAQLDLASMSEVVRKKRSSERGRTTFGLLYSTTAEAPNGKAPGMVVIEGSVTDEELAKLMVGAGKFGPILKFNGTIGADSGKGSETDMATEKTQGLADNAVYITPFMKGRAVDLAPRGNAGGTLGFLLMVAGALAAFGWLRLSQKRKAEQAFAKQGFGV